jgi:hypothetical protein
MRPKSYRRKSESRLLCRWARQSSLISESLAISRQCWATLAKRFFAVGFFAAAEGEAAGSFFWCGFPAGGEDIVAEENPCVAEVGCEAVIAAAVGCGCVAAEALCEAEDWVGCRGLSAPGWSIAPYHTVLGKTALCIKANLAANVSVGAKLSYGGVA